MDRDISLGKGTVFPMFATEYALRPTESGRPTTERLSSFSILSTSLIEHRAQSTFQLLCSFRDRLINAGRSDLDADRLLICWTSLHQTTDVVGTSLSSAIFVGQVNLNASDPAAESFH